MTVVARYLLREILAASLLVFGTLAALFAFFDIFNELGDLGKGGYGLRHILVYVLLSVPGHVYELFPIAALIGTLFALATLAAHSELTVMRASGLSALQLVWALTQVGLLFALLTFVFGEFLAPVSDRAAQQLRLKAQSQVVARDFRSGIWIKDENTFVNIRDVLPDASLARIRIFEFDRDARLRTLGSAATGRFDAGQGQWVLDKVSLTRLERDGAHAERLDRALWRSAITPKLLSVLMVAPQQMSALDLYAYIEHLQENKLNSAAYESALALKIIYPLASVVMIWLAVPFVQGTRREGGVGVKIFIGIVVGLAFHLLNRLFSHLGLLNEWPPMLAAAMPTVLFLCAAVALIWRMERR